MERDLKPEALPERSALPWGCRHTNLYQTLPAEMVLSGHPMSPCIPKAAEKHPITSKVGLVSENCSLTPIRSDVYDCSSKNFHFPFHFPVLLYNPTVGCRTVSVHCPAATTPRAQ